MRAWEQIVNKALLGCEKAPLSAEDLPSAAIDAFDIVTTDDREETFYKLSAFGYQFRQSGVRPLDFKMLARTEAAPEEKQYCSALAHAQLKSILDEDLPKFLELWLHRCAERDQLVHPEIIPPLFDVAQRRKELRQLIVKVSGRRGEWLSRLNPEWAHLIVDADANSVWETGSPDQRREVLATLRMEHPAEGRTLLESTWASEGANEKISFLEILKINLSAADLPWLQGLKEKGQKVNHAILELLKSIPESEIVQEYQSLLSQSISIQTGKAMLGMISKTEIVIDRSFIFPETIFKTGIEKLSSEQGVSDQQNILAQLIMNVPPSFWNRHVNKSPEEALELFRKAKHTEFFLPALAIAAVRFRDATWIKTLLDKDYDILTQSVVSLIEALDENDREPYRLKFFREHPDEIIEMMSASPTEWSADFTKVALRRVAGDIYHYNKTFYRRAAVLMHLSVLTALDSFTPDEEQKKVYWNNQRDELKRLLTLKQQTLQSFDA